MHPQGKKRITNPSYIISFIIPILFVLLGMIICGFAPFGSNCIINSLYGHKGLHSLYYEYYDRFHNGTTIGYSKSLGTGYDFTSLWAAYLSNPLNLLIMIFPRTFIDSAVNLLHVLNTGLAGICMCVYLSDIKSIKKTPIIIVLSSIFALAVSLSGLAVSPSYITSISIFPLILLGSEKIIDKKTPSLFIISMTISAYSSLPMSIVFVFVIMCYLIIRNYKSPIGFAAVFTKICFSTLLIILMSSVIIISVLRGGFYQIKRASDNNSLLIYEISNEIHKSNPSAVVYHSNNSESYDNILVYALSGYDYIISDSADSMGSDGIPSVTKNEYSLENILIPKDVEYYSFNEQDPYNSLNTLSSDIWGVDNVFYDDNLNHLMNSILSFDLSNADSTHYTIDAPESSFIATGYQNTKSLKFFVNGNKVSPLSFLDNIAIIPVNAGINSVEIRYDYGTLFFFLIISLISILFYYAYIKNKLPIRFYSISHRLSLTVSTFFANYQPYIIISIIMSSVFFISQIISQSYPFGINPVMKGDGLVQEYALWSNLINEIKNGRIISSVTFDVSGFYDHFCYKTNNVFLSPWNILKFYFIPRSLVLFDYTIRFMMIYLLSGLTIAFYLTHKYRNPLIKKDPRLTIISTLYGLSSFSLVFIQYKGFRYYFLLPLIILGLEQTIYKNKAVLYICCLSIVMVFDPYHAFLLCEFLPLYFLTMNFENKKDFIYKSARFIKCSIIAALLSAYSIVTCFSLLQSSPYLGDNCNHISLLYFYNSFIYQISEYHNCNIIEAVSSNSSQTASYTGLIMIFVIPLYLFNKQISLNSRIRKIALLMLLFVATNNQVLNFIFHGFHVQSLAPNRFAAFIVFILIEFLSDICTIQINLSKRLLTIILTSISVLMGLLILFNVDSDIKYISVILICIYILSIYIPIKEQNKGITIVKRLIYISLIDIIINAIIVFPSNLGSPSDILKVSDEVRKLSSRASDATDPTALTEYITFSSDYGNLGLISDVSALSFFNASTSQNTMEHISFYNIPTGMNSIFYNHGNPLADIMLNIKYHITDDEDYYSSSIYPQILHQNNLSLHENPYYVSSGFVISHYDSLDGICVEEFKNAIEYQNSITQCLVSKDLYQTIDCELDSSTPSQASYYSLGDLYVNSGGNSITTVFIPMDIHFDQNTSGKIYISYDKYLYYVGTVDENVHELVFDYPMFSYEVSEFKPTIAILDESALQQLSETLSTSTLENIVVKGNSIYGEINVENDGMLYLPYPYSDDWDVYIDNKKVETVKYLGSLCTNISSGNHSVRITYHSPGALLGSIISIATLLILIIRFLRMQYLSNASEASKPNKPKK